MGVRYEYSEDNLPEERYRRPSKVSDEELVNAYNELNSLRKVANRYSMTYESVRSRLNRHKVTDRAVKDAMDAIGTKLTPRMVYYKTHKTGDPTYTVLLKPENEDEEADLADLIEERFSQIPAIKPIKPPKNPTNTNLLTVYPIADAHLGMKAYADEVGEDYNSEICANYLREGISELVNDSPASDTAVILNAGDFFHADNDLNVTPKSKHPLDVTGRHGLNVDIGIDISIEIIEMAARKHKNVIYRALRGNHDENAHMLLSYALYQRFRDNDRITIEKTNMDFFIHEFGKCMICAHHGDKAKAERLVLHAADAWPEIWGRTKWRYYFTGHLHHTKIQDIGGMKCEQLRAATKRDAYAFSNAYSAKSQLQAITYHKEKGEKKRSIVNY